MIGIYCKCLHIYWRCSWWKNSHKQPPEVWCSEEKVFLKHAANLHENNLAEFWHDCFPVNLLHILRILFLKTLMESSFPIHSFPVDTRRHFNVYKTSIWRRRRRIDVLYSLKRRRVSTGLFSMKIIIEAQIAHYPK